MIMIGQQREHPWQVVSARADFHHPHIELRQGAPPQRFFEGRASGQIGFQLLHLGAQLARAHPGA